MVEHEFLRVQHRPEDVVEDELAFRRVISRRLDLGHELLGLLGRGLTGEATDVDLLDNLLGVLFLREEPLDEAAFFDLLNHGGIVEQVQRRKVRRVYFERTDASAANMEAAS